MALVDSGRAIGAVTRLIREHLVRRGFSVTVGKPEDAIEPGPQDAKLNLFLYETGIDPSLRNTSLVEGDPPPLWLQLRYMLTAFDEGDVSDSSDAHDLLGQGVAAVHDLNFLRLDDAVEPEVRLALENNPEPLKVTLQETSSDLLSKLLGGADERYRLSAAFEVRPVMIVPAEPIRFPQRVGIDYTASPNTEIGADGVGLAVIPTMGPRLSGLEPAAVEVGQRATVRGQDLHLGGLEAWLGDVQVRVVSQRPDEAGVEIEGTVVAPATQGPLASGSTLGAGEHPLTLRLPLPGGRYRASNPVLARLLPEVSTADITGSTLSLTGRLLGRWPDDILVALVRDGEVLRLFETGLEPPPAPTSGTVVPGPDQATLTVEGATDGIEAGPCRVVVRVNGQEARHRPEVIAP